MIISNEGNKIIDSNGVVIVSKKTGEWEVISGGGGGGALWVTDNDNTIAKTYAEIKTALDQGKMVYLKRVYTYEDSMTTIVSFLTSMDVDLTTPEYWANFNGDSGSISYVSSSSDGEMHYYDPNSGGPQ